MRGMGKLFFLYDLIQGAVVNAHAHNSIFLFDE